MDLPSVTSCSVKDVFSISFYYLNEIKALWQDRGVSKARCADNSSSETKPKVPFTMHWGLMSCKRAKMSGRAKLFVLCLMRNGAAFNALDFFVFFREWSSISQLLCRVKKEENTVLMLGVFENSWLGVKWVGNFH